MDVKIVFLNANLDKEIYMSQPKCFIEMGQEQNVYRLLNSIYGLKQASRSWNIIFDKTIKSFSFHQSIDEACVYKLRRDKYVVFLVLYVEDILLMGDNIKFLTDVKDWLATQFKMKDLGNANYVLGIKILKDRKNRVLALSQATYIDKVLTRFSMQNSKKGLVLT